MNGGPITLELIEPRHLVIEEPTRLAPRSLRSLEGRVVGGLWNSKAEGDETMRQILKLLVEEYGAKETRFFKKPSASGPAKPGQLDEIAQGVDAFVTGIGD